MRGYIKKGLIIVGTCACLLCACSESKSSLNKTIAGLEDEISQLKQLNMHLQNQIAVENNKKASDYKTTMLKDIKNMPLYGSYYDDSIPAYGPIATLNASAMNFEQSMKIIEQNDYLTKVVIEGVIPTWNLTDQADVFFSSVDKDMYVIENAYLYIEPSIEGHILRDISSGRAVHVIYEDRDWYYIKINRLVSPNDIRTGWIKKLKLGTTKDFTTRLNLDVCIPAGKTIYTIDQNDKIVESQYNEQWWSYMYESGVIWGHIFEEKDAYYVVSLPGASLVAIKQEDARFADAE